MPLRLMAAGRTDTGLQREQNEDALYTRLIDDHPASGIFIVSDGMGGYHAGEVASELAVETIRDDLGAIFTQTSDQTTVKLGNRRGRKRTKSGKLDPGKTKPLPKAQDDDEADTADTAATADTSDAASADIETPAAEITASETPEETPAQTAAAEAADGDDSDEAGDTRHLLESVVMEHYADKLRLAVEHSSQAIVDYGNEHREARGMGATVTSALVIDGQAFIANVGDSRTYLLRDGKLDRVTRDHSLVQRLVEAGQIEPDDVYDHPSRNLIYRSLGAGHAAVDVDIFVEKLRAGDALLLCSDGLWEMIRDPILEKLINEQHDVEKACETLIKVANENGGEDNITAVLVRVVEA
ncbi:MAG TPA: protein phosphatase 2C domain-containing protein [Ktedonobacterales bacterium]